MLVGHAIEVCGIMDEQTLGTGHGDEPLVRTSAALFGWNGELYQSIDACAHICIHACTCMKTTVLLSGKHYDIHRPVVIGSHMS